jgi:uncharacterized protein (TIGR02117 family)
MQAHQSPDNSSRTKRTKKPTAQGALQKVLRCFKRCIKWLSAVVLIYLAILAMGLLPVNNDFRAAKNGIKIYLISSAVHADIIVPKTTATKDWTQRFSASTFVRPIANETHIAFGWGDRGFYLETETWADLKLSTVVNALFLPSRSCVHVTYIRPEYYRDVVSVTISERQYEALVKFIESTFRKGSYGEWVQIPGYAYSTNDAFYDANGSYHLFNTCNSWVGRGLKSAGVRVPWFSPMPKSPMLYIEKE